MSILYLPYVCVRYIFHSWILDQTVFRPLLGPFNRSIIINVKKRVVITPFMKCLK